MARTKVRVEIERDALQDAIHDMGSAYAALSKRHGPQFRALERKIEKFAEGEVSAVDFSHIGGKVLMAHASPELAAVLKEARSLGVIQ